MAQAHPKSPESVAAKSSLTPCILDDDPAQLEMLAALVADMGYESVPTSSAEEALKRAESGKLLPEERAIVQLAESRM